MSTAVGDTTTRVRPSFLSRKFSGKAARFRLGAALWLCGVACATSSVDWRTYHAAAEAAAERGDYERAEEYLAGAEREAKRLGPGEEAMTCVTQARLRREVGDHEAALRLYSETETLLESSEVQPGHGSRAPARLALERGHMALAVGDPASAEAHFQRAVREARRNEGRDSLTEGWALVGLGRSLRLQANPAGARGALLRALTIHRGETSTATVRPAHTRGVMATLTELAALERTEGRLTPARKHLIDALRLGRAEVGVSHPRVAVVLTELALVELAHGNIPAAAEAARRADEIASSQLPAEHVTRLEAARVLESVVSAESALTPP